MKKVTKQGCKGSFSAADLCRGGSRLNKKSPIIVEFQNFIFSHLKENNSSVLLESCCSERKSLKAKEITLWKQSMIICWECRQDRCGSFEVPWDFICSFAASLELNGCSAFLSNTWKLVMFPGLFPTWNFPGNSIKAIPGKSFSIPGNFGKLK